MLFLAILLIRYLQSVRSVSLYSCYIVRAGSGVVYVLVCSINGYWYGMVWDGLLLFDCLTCMLYYFRSL